MKCGCTFLTTCHACEMAELRFEMAQLMEEIEVFIASLRFLGQSQLGNEVEVPAESGFVWFDIEALPETNHPLGLE